MELTETNDLVSKYVYWYKYAVPAAHCPKNNLNFHTQKPPRSGLEQMQQYTCKSDTIDKLYPDRQC